MKEYFLLTVCCYVEFVSQKWLQNIKCQLNQQPFHTFSCVIVCMLVIYCTLVLQQGALGTWRERNTYQEGRKLLLHSSGTTAVKCFITCSPTVIDTYIRPPVLPQKHLETPQSTVSPLSSISLSVLLPHCSYQTAAALWLSPLSTSFSHLSHLSSYPSYNVS